MQDGRRWYDRARMPYQRDAVTVKAYADWLFEAQWSLYATFTFARRVSDAQAIKTFDAFINRLERTIRADVAYVRGDDRRQSKFRSDDKQNS
jgi:hypothetical protein